MAQVITLAGERLFALKAQNNAQLDIDTFIFANVPGQDSTTPIDRNEGLPPLAQRVHSQIVQQTGRVNDNVVIYSTVLDSLTGPFDFNWVGLYSSVNQTLIAISHVPVVKKTITEPGAAGNTLNRNFGIEYSGIAELTGITINPETWQIDHNARLNGMDELTRQLAEDMNGKDWFIDDGFKVEPRSTLNTFNVTAGAGYVSGLRVELATDHIITLSSYPQFVYVDAWFDGDSNSVWKGKTAFTVTNSEMSDYIDVNGKQHYVFKLARISAADELEDLRNDTKAVDTLRSVAISNNASYGEVAYLAKGLVSGIKLFFNTSNQLTYRSNNFITGSISSIGEDVGGTLTIIVDGIKVKLSANKNQLGGIVYIDDYPYLGDLASLLKSLIISPVDNVAIYLGAKTYNIKDVYSHNFNLGAGPFIGNKSKGLTIIGAKMPRLADDGKSLIEGTVIQGTLFNLADGFECKNLGVDFGTNVVTDIYEGEYGEGFVPCANTDYPNPQEKIKNIAFDNIISLVAEPIAGNVNTLKHSTLCENGKNVRIGYVESIGGSHSFVSKNEDFHAKTIITRGGGGGLASEEGVIFKSDSANSCKKNYVDNLICDSYFLDGVEIKSGGLVFQTHISNTLASVKIKNFQLSNASKGVRASGAGVIDSCTIDTQTIDNVETVPVNIGDQFRFLKLGKSTVINCPSALTMGANNISVDIGDWTIVPVGSQAETQMTLNGDYSHGSIKYSNTAGNFTGSKFIQRNGGDLDPTKLNLSPLDNDKWFSSLNVIANASNLINGWTEKVITNFAGFAVVKYAGMLHLQGRLIPPVSNVNPFNLSALLVSKGTQSQAVAETSTFEIVPARVDISSSGAVTVPAISTFQSGYIILDGITIKTAT